MRRLHQHSLALFFLTILIAALVGQAIAGHADYNNDEIEHAQLLDEQPQRCRSAATWCPRASARR